LIKGLSALREAVHLKQTNCSKGEGNIHYQKDGGGD